MPLSEPNPWPLLLVGPMVRRVTTTSASVFVATSSACKVTLEVWDGATKVATGTATDTVAIGSKLHVLVASVAGSFVAGKVYRYDVAFTIASKTQRLADLGLLRGEHPLGYAADVLPSFVLPQPLTSLVLLYASCRKPHGGGPDMLPHVDDMLAATRNDPVRRPQQLVLGGDQIYADDVEGSLREVLTTRGQQLLGWTETLPDGSTPTTAMDPKKSVGRSNRSRHLMDQGFKAFDDRDYTRNHLLFFAEWVAMYAMVWSPVLWPTKQAGVPLFPNAPGKQPPAGADALRVAEHPADVAAYAEVERFAAGLARVRRALANVATYMIFDDHEISDDWFLNDRVHKRQRGCPLGRRILRNGLAAYAVFQDWGNQPTHYDGSGLGRQILDKLQMQAAKPAIADTPTALDALLDCGSTVNPNLATRKSWHYWFEGPGHVVAVLDTRTWRVFPADVRAAGLINPTSIQLQIAPLGAAKDKQPIVVSAAPVLGHTFIEELQLTRIAYDGEPIHKEEKWDFEPWGANEDAFKQLLTWVAALTTRPTVYLSGDVHYAFTTIADVGKFGGPAKRHVQLCSSAAKNAELKTRLSTVLSLPQSQASNYYDYRFSPGWSLYGATENIFHMLQAASPAWHSAKDLLTAAVPAFALESTKEWLETIEGWSETLEEWDDWLDNPLAMMGWSTALWLGRVPLEKAAAAATALGLDLAGLLFVGVEAIEDIRDGVRAKIGEGPCSPIGLLTPPNPAVFSLPAHVGEAARWRELGTIGTTNVGMVRFQECRGQRWLLHDILWPAQGLITPDTWVEPQSTQHWVRLTHPATLGQLLGGTP